MRNSVQADREARLFIFEHRYEEFIRRERIIVKKIMSHAECVPGLSKQYDERGIAEIALT